MSQCQVDLSQETLDCSCLSCGRRFEFNFGKAAANRSVTCPACGEVIELGDQLSRFEERVANVAGTLRSCARGAAFERDE